MLKKTIKYEDFNGETREEDFYFNISKAEIVEMQLSSKEGFDETLKRIIASNDGKQIIQHFKDIVLMAYGKRTDDGRSFVKTDAIREEFAGTNAYSELFFELATDAEQASAFIRGVVPADMAGSITDVELPSGDEKVPTPLEDGKDWTEYSQDELLGMTEPDFQRLVAKVKGPKPQMLMTIGMMRKSQS